MGMAVVIAALASLASAFPALALEPHENPDTALSEFDVVWVLGKYSEALDHVLGRNAAGVEALQEQASWANVPGDLRDTVNIFLSSGYSLAGLLPAIEADMEDWRRMLAQFRPEEAEASSAAAAQKLGQAYSELGTMERGARRTWQSWQAESAPEGTTLRVAYKEVEARLLRLRRQLDLLGEMRRSLTQQTEMVTRTSGLLPTSMTLSMEPMAAFVGDSVEFRGSLTAEGKPLPGRKVTVMLAGSPVSEVFTDSGGFYQGRLVLPYQYVSEMGLQAIYYPQEEDIGFYLGCSSPRVTIKVLYYPTKLSLEVPGNAYPGRKLRLPGSLDYGDSPVPEGRSLLVYWDGELAAEETVAAAFSLELPVMPEMSLGKHQVMLYVPPQGRYAPAWARTAVEVIKTIPVIDIDAPGVILLPFTLDVRGRAYSPLGPLQDASLGIALGKWEASARSQEDGTFSARLHTGMSLTLVGSQELRVSVTPREPWHRASSLATGLLLINPVNIVGLAIILAIPVFFGAHWLRRRAVRAPATPRPQPVPALVRTESPPRQAKPAQPEARGAPDAVLIALYRGVLKLVQRLTAVVLRPSHTLREFAQECAPRLGPLAGYFQEFTLMIERLLYSRHHPSQADAARGWELSRRLEEGTKGEGV